MKLQDAVDWPSRDEDRPAVRTALMELYRDLDRAVAEQGPICELSGRCCRFEEYGHTLFMTAPEADLLIADAPPPVRPLDDGMTCPWQDGAGHCTARGARPLGCRVYYCDLSYSEKAPELTETFLGRLRQIAATHGWPWGYGPLHEHLRQARDEGRLAIESLGNHPAADTEILRG